MADQFVQKNSNTGTSTVSVTLSGVTSPNSIVAFLFDGSSAGSSLSVSDGTSYTAMSPPGTVSDSGNAISSGIFLRQNCSAGSHTIVGTLVAGHLGFMMCVEVQAPASYSTTNIANGADQVSPGAGANILSSGTCTASGASTLVGFLNDNSSTNTTDEPTAGTSPNAFTSRDNNANTTMGAWRLETCGIASSAAATGGPVTTTDHFITLGIAIPNAGGAASIPLMGQACL